MSSKPVRERINYYFLSMGAQPAGCDGQGDEASLEYELDGEPIRVIVLGDEWTASRAAILKAAMDAASYSLSGKLTYIAMPQMLTAAIDGSVFQEKGIGIISYDGRKIVEVLPARRHLKAGPENQALPEHIMREVERLKAAYDGLLRLVERLEDEIVKLKASRSFTESGLGSELKMMGTEHEEAAIETSAYKPRLPSTLPSYLDGNPWLEVLSRRGRD